ncbi:hypothetical protein ABZ397_19710 [Streptomyces sp. NPDC005876]|uniref:hypothetical protein n=1 Tax=Streptomyces sp. NPDC005876 TaxID=3157076 RepID=UPI0033F89882
MAAVAAAGVLAGTLLTGCGDGGDGAGTHDGGKDREQHKVQGAAAVRGAYDRTAGAGTARMTLKVTTAAEGRSVTVRGKGAIDLAEGDSVMTVTAEGQRIEQRVVDRALYQKLPGEGGGQQSGDKPWVKIDLKRAAAQGGTGGQGVGDPAQTVAYARGITEKDVTETGEEEVGGVRTTRYRVKVDVADLPRGETLREQVGPTLPMDVWLDEQGRIRRQQIDMTVKASESGGSASPRQVKVRTLTEYSDFGAEVEAEPPAAGEVTDVTDKVLKGRSAA